MFTRAAATAAVLFLLGGPALAHEFKVGEITIEHPWARPTPPMAPVASGYITLINNGEKPDRLVEIRSPASESAEIHQSTIVDGVARMRPLKEGVTLEPGSTVDFEVEKLHIMFIKPVKTLQDKESFTATLVFEQAGPVDIEFAVQRKASENAPADHNSHGMKSQ